MRRIDLANSETDQGILIKRACSDRTAFALLYRILANGDHNRGEVGRGGGRFLCLTTLYSWVKCRVNSQVSRCLPFKE